MDESIASLFARIGADIAGLAKGLRQAKNSLTRAGKSMRVTGSALMATLGVSAAKAGKDFDAQMQNIQLISKQTDAALYALSHPSKKLTKRFKKLKRYFTTPQ